MLPGANRSLHGDSSDVRLSASVDSYHSGFFIPIASASRGLGLLGLSFF